MWPFHTWLPTRMVEGRRRLGDHGQCSAESGEIRVPAAFRSLLPEDFQEARGGEVT